MTELEPHPDMFWPQHSFLLNHITEEAILVLEVRVFKGINSIYVVQLADNCPGHLTLLRV